METKIVTIESNHPFVIRGVYARSIYMQELTLDEIYSCLIQKTSVTEHLENGSTKRLDLNNYKGTPTVEQKIVESEVKDQAKVKEQQTVTTEQPKDTKSTVIDIPLPKFNQTDNKAQTTKKNK